MAIVVILNVMVISSACADPIEKSAVISEVMERLNANQLDETILEAAKALFWSLAAISLVWTMGALIVRQDIGELLMELLRFVIVTGLFYWLLVNASSRQGGEDFVGDVVASFLQMASGSPSDETVRGHGDGVMSKGLIAYFDVLLHTGDGENADRVLSGIIAIAILCVCSVMAAQFLLALVMAWILGYAGIFLLGFGGARWTSSIAINYYKHVAAVGAALLVLSLAGAITGSLLDDIGQEGTSRNYAAFASLGMMLGISILMMVVSVKVPQMIYTLVTGSVVGLYAGSANAAGTAIAAGGTSAYAAAVGRFPGGGGGVSNGSAPGGPAGCGAPLRTESVMDAVHRSASMAGSMADPFHVNSGAEPFGVARAPDVHRSGARRGSVFGPMPVDESSTTADRSAFGMIENASSASHSPSVDRRTAPKHGPSQGVPKALSLGMSGEQESSASFSGSVDVNETGPNGYVSTTRIAATLVSVSSDVDRYGNESLLRVQRGIDIAPGLERGVGSIAPHGAGDEPLVVQGVPGSIGSSAGSSAADMAIDAASGHTNVSDTVGQAHQVRAGEANHDSEHTRTIEVLRSRSDASTATSATVDVVRSESAATTLTATGHEAAREGDANASPSSVETQTSRIASTANSPEVHAVTLVQEDGRAAPTSEEMRGGLRSAIVDASGDATRTAALTTRERHAVPPMSNDLDVRGASEASSSSVQADDAALMRSGRAPGVSPRLASAHTPATSVVQEDMQAAPHSEEVQMIMPGAVSATPDPAHVRTSSEDAAISGDRPPRHRKRRARRQPDEAPSTMPPVDSEELSDEDKP